MSELSEFLLARIAEDESGETNARIITECEAKRAIVDLHQGVEDKGWKSGEAHGYLWCASCGSLDDSPVPYPCDTLKAIANVYRKVGGKDE